MPRRRPSRLRAAVGRPATRAIPGVPLATALALDRLDRSEISSLRVNQALETWKRTAALPEAVLSAPHSDWTEFIGPTARDELERALQALPTRQAAALRVLIARADDAFREKTLNNPTADPLQPWWARRWSH